MVIDTSFITCFHRYGQRVVNFQICEPLSRRQVVDSRKHEILIAGNETRAPKSEIKLFIEVLLNKNHLKMYNIMEGEGESAG